MNDLAARAAAIAVAARESAPAKREARREAMPATAAFWDEWTGVFGAFRYMRMEEGGQTVEFGKPLQHTTAVQASKSTAPGKLLRERR